MKETKKWWIGILGGGTLLAAGLGTLIHFQLEKNDQTRLEIEGVRTEIASARKLIEGTKKLERDVIVLREISQVIKGILPNTEDVNELVRTFQEFSRTSKAMITAVKKKPDNRGQKNSFERVAYSLSVQADIFQLLDFLNEVETFDRFMRVPTFRVTAGQRGLMGSEGTPAHRVQLDVESFVYETQKGTKPVRIEGYDRKRDLLMGEINRRREALTVSDYKYRGIRGRRDPWIDPRIPKGKDGDSALSVQEQMEVVQELFDRTRASLTMWDEIRSAENVIEEMIGRQNLEKALTELEADVRRIESEGGINYIPSARRLQAEVVDVLVQLREDLNASEAGRGPSEAALNEVMRSMENHLEHGEYLLMLEAFGAVEGRLDLAETDSLRKPYIEKLREMARVARTVIDFEHLDLRINGLALMQGASPVVLIDGRSYGIGDLIGDELVVYAIESDEVEFLFRGVILARRL